MSKDWIIDVLTDLKAFARQNDMPCLAEQLDDTVLVAAAELAQMSEARLDEATVYDTTVGKLPRGPQ